MLSALSMCARLASLCPLFPSLLLPVSERAQVRLLPLSAVLTSSIARTLLCSGRVLGLSLSPFCPILFSASLFPNLN